MKRVDIIMSKLVKKQKTDKDKDERDEQDVATDSSVPTINFRDSQTSLRGTYDLNVNRQNDTPQSSPLRAMSPETEKIYKILSKNLDNDDDGIFILQSPSTLVAQEELNDERICLDHPNNNQPASLVRSLEDNPESPLLLSNLSIPPPSFSPLTPLVRNINKNTPDPDINLFQPGENEENISANREDFLNAINDSDDSVNDPNYVVERVVEESNDSDVTEVPDEQPETVKQGRSKKGRKLKYKYNRDEQKKRKYQNLSYCTKKKLVEPKIFKDYNCTCKKKCSDLVSKNIREQEFLKFVHLGSYVAQVTYLAACITETKKKRSYTVASSPSKSKPREFSRIYNINGICVCRDMFCKTFQVSPQKITISLKKMRDGAKIVDKRGEKARGWNKLDKAHFDFIVDIIEKLPKYESHYTRNKNSDKKFLQPGMTVAKIYDLYKNEYLNKYGPEAKSVTYNTVQKIFLKQFNLRCKSLKKDTCNKCDLFTTNLNNLTNLTQREQIRSDKDKHLEIAQTLRNRMKEDFEQAKTCKEIECLSFDLEKTLPLPRIPTNIIFYKRQLWVYNCGVHSASDDVGHCYIWAEGEAGRGAQEVGSCLIKYIKNKLPSDVTQLILWSDCCGGQNRNIKVVLMLKAILNNHPTLKSISLRYLESGHTFLPNDSDFAKIETRLKQHQRVYTIEEYIDIMKKCKRINPLKVERMKNSDFVGSKDLEKKIVNRKVFVDKTKVNWLKTKEILLKKEEPYSVFMRTSFEEAYGELFIQKKVKGNIFEITDRDLKPLWPSGKAINQNKLNDLMSIYHLIPADCIEYYKSLKGTNTVNDDVDGFGEPDFEIEDENDC